MVGFCCSTCFGCAAGCAESTTMEPDDEPMTTSPPPSPEPCEDTPPDSSGNCTQQQEWGKCDEDWMVGFCCSTCFGCAAGCAESTTMEPSESTTMDPGESTTMDPMEPTTIDPVEPTTAPV